jgi:hypothetical protein
VSFNKIREIMRDRPDNPNFVGNKAAWMIFRVLKYATDMRLCGQKRIKTRLNSHKLILNSVSCCYHLWYGNSGLRYHFFNIFSKGYGFPWPFFLLFRCCSAKFWSKLSASIRNYSCVFIGWESLIMLTQH